MLGKSEIISMVEFSKKAHGLKQYLKDYQCVILLCHICTHN